ncbi:hypothetical protein C8J57DRAFT_1294134 [Mycena rebaudengoi]|nr:hypothetical protein C8J57DRAFT_1294134 [Mycena rebaudengoi]
MFATFLLFAPLLAFGFPTSLTATLSTKLIYQSPTGLFLENIAVRPCSNLLLTSLLSPSLLTLDPTATVPTLDTVFSFPNSTGLTGIVEYRPDVYAVVAAQLNITTARDAPGSASVWSVDMTDSARPRVKKITSLPTLTDGIFNGVTTVAGRPDVVLVAESVSGSVWEINTLTGASRIAIQDESMAPGTTEAPIVLGINGVRTYGDALYFTNTLRRTFSRVPLDVRGAHVRPAGAVQLLVRSEAGGIPDDFAIDAKGFAWVAWIQPSRLSLLRPAPVTGVWEETDLGWNTTTTFGAPSSVAFGRGNSVQQKTAYITTQAGQIVALDTKGV